MFKEDLAQYNSAEEQKKARTYWFRAVTFTLQDRSLTPFPPPPKRGTHGHRVEFVKSFWRIQPDDQLYELFYYLKPYFAQGKHRDTDMS